MSLNGDPNNLQGGTPTLQAGGNPQPQSFNPQIVANPAAPLPVQSSPGPTPTPPTSQPAVVPPHIAQRDTSLNSIFSPYIDSRPSQANPSVLEYFNKQNNQGFSSAGDLFNFASQLGAGQITSFDQLHAPVVSNAGFTGTGQDTQPANLTDPSQQIAKTAGLANLNPDDLQKILNASTVLTPDEIAQIRASVGITPDVESTAFTLPGKTLEQFYTDAYNAAGLGDIKQKFLDLNDQINQAKADYATAVGNTNENPFLDEASRVGRLSRLQDQSNLRIQNLTTQAQQLKDLYSQGLGEVENLTAKHQSDLQTQQSLNTAHLNYLLNRAEQVASATQSTKAAQVYRYLPDYLQAKVQGNTPTTIGNSDTGFYRYNATTGKFEQVAPGVGKYEANQATGELFNTLTGQPFGSNGTPFTAAFGASAPARLLTIQKNNNPGALMDASGKPLQFATPQEGWQALQNDIQAKINGNNGYGLGPNSTLQDFFSVYSPASAGNDPVAYAAAVAQQLGVSPTTQLGTLSTRTPELAVAIAQHEGYFNGSTEPGTYGGNIIDQAAQALVNGSAAPSQYSKRGATYNTILDRANQLSLQQKGVPFDAQQAEVNFSNKEAVRPILNNEQSAEAHLDTVLSLSSKFDRGETPALNEANLASAQYITGNSDANNYLTAVHDAQAEIAKVLSGTGTPTDQARDEAATMLNPNLGPKALASQIATIRTLMKQKVAAYTNPSTGSTSPSPSPNISDLNFALP